MKRLRPTWAEINLKNIQYNYTQIKNKIHQRTKIMAVVKANAYGHGSCEVAKTLETEGVDYLGVATLDEAVKLRKCGVSAPILVLGALLPHEAEAAYKYDITVTVSNPEFLEALKRSDLNYKIHVNVDTGMGRIGVWHENAFDFISRIKNKCKKISIEGIYTHFSIAGRDKFFTQHQIDSFNEVIKKLEQAGITIPLKHASNSIAVIDWKKSHFNMIRPGIILYGVYPKRNFAKQIKLKPALSLHTKIAFIKDVPAGRSISYGRTFITQIPTRIASLPIGYADGYGRILSGKSKVLVKGKHAPLAGKVTMDMTMIDVGHIKNVKVGDKVVLIGTQGRERILLEEISRMAGTIPYEILTGITYRVPRIYKSSKSS